jgi:hypothetical protein
MANNKLKKTYRVYGYKDVEEPDDKTAFQAFNYMDLHKVTTIGCEELEGLDELKAEEKKRNEDKRRSVNKELLNQREFLFELIVSSYERIRIDKNMSAGKLLDALALDLVEGGMFLEHIECDYIEIVESGNHSSSEFFRGQFNERG